LIRALAILLEKSGHLLVCGEPVFTHVYGASFERFALILRQAVHTPIFAPVFFTHVASVPDAAEFSRVE
jgi:hypothetical protein